VRFTEPAGKLGEEAAEEIAVPGCSAVSDCACAVPTFDRAEKVRSRSSKVEQLVFQLIVDPVRRWKSYRALIICNWQAKTALSPNRFMHTFRAQGHGKLQIAGEMCAK
jgi:transposase